MHETKGNTSNCRKTGNSFGGSEVSFTILMGVDLLRYTSKFAVGASSEPSFVRILQTYATILSR